MLTRMKQRITFQTVSTVSAGGGCFTETWSNYATRWANVKIYQANESEAYGKDQQVNRYRIIVRKENFTNKMRIVFGSETLEIETVRDIAQEKRMLEIIARCDIA